MEYDEHGFDKREGLTEFVTTDDTIPDYYIQAPPEMLEKAKMKPQGVFRDYDIDAKTANDE